jgi:hypothetical protein
MGWNDVVKSGSKINVLKLASGSKYTIRLLAPPKKFYKYYNQEAKASVIVEDPDNCILSKKYNIDPQVRYGLLVLNRSTGEVAVVETSGSVVQPMKQWKDDTGKDPSGPVAPDFKITVTGNGKMTRYAVTVMPDLKPLTDAEKATVEESAIDLNKFFKASPENEVEARYSGTFVKETNVGGNGPVSSNKAPATSSVSKNARKSDDFESDDQDPGF